LSSERVREEHTSSHVSSVESESDVGGVDRSSRTRAVHCASDRARFSYAIGIQDLQEAHTLEAAGSLDLFSSRARPRYRDEALS